MTHRTAKATIVTVISTIPTRAEKFIAVAMVPGPAR